MRIAASPVDHRPRRADGGARRHRPALLRAGGHPPVYATLPGRHRSQDQTSAEIITATPDGMTLIFTDSPGKRIGFVDIADPAAPRQGSLAMGGEPTSATVVVAPAGRGQYLGEQGEPKRPPRGRRPGDGAMRRGWPTGFGGSQRRWQVPGGGGRERARRGPERWRAAAAAGGPVAIFDLGADGRPTNCDAARIVEVTGLAAVRPGPRARVRRRQRGQRGGGPCRRTTPSS